MWLQLYVRQTRVGRRLGPSLASLARFLSSAVSTPILESEQDFRDYFYAFSRSVEKAFC